MHMTTNIGKPYEGKPHVRFDEEGLGSAQPFTLVYICILTASDFDERLAEACIGIKSVLQQHLDGFPASGDFSKRMIKIPQMERRNFRRS